MVTKSIWLFSISIFVSITPPAEQLYSYISLTPSSSLSLENKFSPYLSLCWRIHIQLEPAFVCSCRDRNSTHTATAISTKTTVPKDREGGGLHCPSMISPLRTCLTRPPLISIPSTSSICGFQSCASSFQYGSRY